MGNFSKTINILEFFKYFTPLNVINLSNSENQYNWQTVLDKLQLAQKQNRNDTCHIYNLFKTVHQVSLIAGKKRLFHIKEHVKYQITYPLIYEGQKSVLIENEQVPIVTDVRLFDGTSDSSYERMDTYETTVGQLYGEDWRRRGGRGWRTCNFHRKYTYHNNWTLNEI